MKILLIFTLFLISVGGGESETVTGYSGGGVLIKCKYETQYTSNPKYLCKGPWSNCGDRIKTGVKNEWITSGRFSLFDDTRAAQFWVLMRELTVEDSGTYQCAVNISQLSDIYTPVELNVKEDQSYEKSISVSGHVGQSVNISCKYPQSHRSGIKFLCKRMGYTTCTYKTPVNESRRWIEAGKLSLHDDRVKQILTVSFNSLTEGDSGEYWCGAESDWTSDHVYKVYITQINLRVTEYEQQATRSSSTRTTPQGVKATTSAISKTTGTSAMETKTTEFPVFSVVTGVSVILLLLLIGLLCFIYAQRKRSKTQVRMLYQNQSIVGSSSNQEVPYVLSVHEEIKNMFSSDADVSTVYSTAQLPTNPSEPSETIYDNDQLCKNPSEPSETVYDNVQLPTNPSEPSETIYDNDQLPTNPSQPSETVYDNVQLPLSPISFSNPVYSTAPLPPNSPD
ncbi:CMRF35-like molecule 8 [Pygocentrus nattereri]|uniref:Ig-like domain-containing protein n=1 Tax=Pygocentrus nattereri TaxID=42514 RepID=A0AAR2LI36_PYGNA|nr:CMRF35-like molecule 8 [Pygocentrus nattereri]